MSRKPHRGIQAGDRFTLLHVDGEGFVRDGLDLENFRIAEAATADLALEEKETPVSVPTPPSDQHDILDRMAELETQVAELKAQTAFLDNYISVVDENFGKQLNVLRDCFRDLTPGPKVDPIADRIIGFLRGVPGVRFNPTSVWENLGGEDTGVENSRIAEKLDSLANRGIVTRHKREGRRALYSIEAE